MGQKQDAGGWNEEKDRLIETGRRAGGQNVPVVDTAIVDVACITIQGVNSDWAAVWKVGTNECLLLSKHL